MTASEDDGKSWSRPVLATQPHKYTNGKVHVGHKLKDGRLAVGYSWDIFCEQGLSPATEGEMDLRAGLMLSTDGGRHWVAGGDISARPPKLTPHAVNGVDEPATVILELVWAAFGYPLMAPLVIFVFVPFYAKLNLYTAYECLEGRFSLNVRLPRPVFRTRISLLLPTARTILVQDRAINRSARLSASLLETGGHTGQGKGDHTVS